MIGLGRMGANMAERLLQRGHRVVGFDRDPAAVALIAGKGAQSAGSLDALTGDLQTPRVIWLMVPAGDPVDQTISDLLPSLSPGDTIVDGGNSNYKDSSRRSQTLRARGIHFVDVGTSGGVWGLQEGYSLTIGGDPEAVGRLNPLFAALAPSPEKGWGHVGPSGAGHFVKMIHNGIEYGMMQAYAEGFAIMEKKAELSLDLSQVSEIWRHGSVIRSWLLDLTADALQANPTMAGIAPFVPDSGEGRWTVQEATDLNVPAPVITLSLIQRIQSRDADAFPARLLSMLRGKFGGHAVKREG